MASGTFLARFWRVSGACIVHFFNTTFIARRPQDRKGNELLRAAGITGAALLSGILLGSALQAWLRVDLVPLLGVSSPGELVGMLGIAAAWAATAALA